MKTIHATAMRRVRIGQIVQAESDRWHRVANVRNHGPGFIELTYENGSAESAPADETVSLMPTLSEPTVRMLRTIRDHRVVVHRPGGAPYADDLPFPNALSKTPLLTLSDLGLATEPEHPSARWAITAFGARVLELLDGAGV